jgi:hypothetical protein
MNLIEREVVELRRRFVNLYDGVVASVDLQLRATPHRCEVTGRCEYEILPL